ncbi:MAG: YihY/virulence factor BrkB family protein [Flaviaesturariibacter sp.]|nr:YihY/virulence factor BrkB family protein [Flaviaesturariibacter sp.]
MSKIKFSLKNVWPLLKAAFKGFLADKVPKLSASLAYYTIFALGPLLVVIITVCAIVMGSDAINNTIYNQMNDFVGPEAAKQMQEIVKNASLSGKSPVAAIISGIVLLIGATSIFGEIQDSINDIWGLKPKPKAGIWVLIKNRLLSFGILGSLGFLMLVSLGATALVETIGDRLKDKFPDVTVVVFYIINLVLTLAITTLLFAVIFRVLPDAKIKWKDVWVGSIVTSLFFLLGKFGISFYISKADVGGTYGTAGSLVIILVWIYYSSMILYFGAEFTKAYVMAHGDPIHPNKYAVTIEKVEIDKGKQSVQQVEKNAGKQEAKGSPHQPAAAPKKHVVPPYNAKTASSASYTESRSTPSRPKPAASPLAYAKSEAPARGTHLSGVPAIAVGLVAFVVEFVRSNRSSGY